MGLYRGRIGTIAFGEALPPIMEDQAAKNTDNEMEARIIQGLGVPQN